MTKKLWTALAVLSLYAASASAADVYAIDKVHSEVSFKVRHFVTKVPGRFTDFEGTIVADPAKPEASSVEFKIRTASVDTAVEKRDNHLRTKDFFDVEKYPEITFKSSRVKAAGKDRYDVTGTFTLRGVSKEITLPVTFLGFAKDPWGGERAGFETGMTLNRKEYGILWNQALDTGGFVLGDEVWITINLETVKQKPQGPTD